MRLSMRRRAMWNVRVRDRPTARKRRSSSTPSSRAVGQLSRAASCPTFKGVGKIQGPGLPLRALASRRGSEGQARGGDRHRRHRLPVRPRHRARGEAAEGVPAHPALARADARLSRGCRRGEEMAARSTCRLYAKWYRFFLFWMLTDGFCDGQARSHLERRRQIPSAPRTTCCVRCSRNTCRRRSPTART